MAFIKGYINDPSCKPFTNLRDSPSIALCVLAVHVSVSQHVPTEESFMFVLKCFEEPPTCLVLLGFPKKIRKDHSIKYLLLPSRSRIPWVPMNSSRHKSVIATILNSSSYIPMIPMMLYCISMYFHKIPVILSNMGKHGITAARLIHQHKLCESQLSHPKSVIKSPWITMVSWINHHKWPWFLWFFLWFSYGFPMVFPTFPNS